MSDDSRYYTGKARKELTVAYFKALSHKLLGGLRKTAKTISEERRLRAEIRIRDLPNTK
jgi:hypothetical protein